MYFRSMAKQQPHSKPVPRDEFLRLLHSEELARALSTSNEQLGSFEKRRLKVLAGEQLKRATRGLVSECGWRLGREATEELVREALDNVEKLRAKLAEGAGEPTARTATGCGFSIL
jgi:hypothetical protein